MVSPEYLKEHQSYKEGDLNYKILSSLENNKSVLSVGCGAGREVKLLVSKGMKVTAIDFSEEMIKSSKKIEPKAEYILIDVLDFIKKDDRKFDYIVLMYNFLNGIRKKERDYLLKALVNMLNKDGEVIFVVKLMNHKPKELLRFFVSLVYLPFSKGYEFGDILIRDYDKGYCVTHLFTKRQLRKIFKEFNSEINKTVIIVRRRA